jgi:hypothetical protein
MAKMLWICIGQGSKKQELQHVIAVLKKRWQQRYEFKIDEESHEEIEQSERYQLLIRHT